MDEIKNPHQQASPTSQEPQAALQELTEAELAQAAGGKNQLAEEKKEQASQPVLPAVPADVTELSSAQLEEVAGGLLQLDSRPVARPH